jgi:FKBP-type peptidyl-prolyl cis-trans isomerase
MIRIVFTASIFLTLVGCNLSGVDQQEDESYKIQTTDSSVDSLVVTENLEIKEATPSDTLFLESGIYIAYIRRGEGKQLKEDDVVMMDYKSALLDGKVFDTNEKFGKPIPFMIGWGLQTSGWDIALPYLKEGDEVKVFLPAKYARGEKGIPDVVPPNSDNLLSLKIHKILPVDYTDDGVEIWVINRGKEQVNLKEGDEVYIDYFAHAKTNPRYDNSFKNGEPYQIKVGGKNNLPGLNKGLSKAKLSDKLWVRIPSKHAFGSKGNQDLVKPNETVFFDLRVLKIIEE